MEENKNQEEQKTVEVEQLVLSESTTEIVHAKKKETSSCCSC